MKHTPEASTPIQHQISCSDTRALEDAYLRVAEASWIEGCTVDVTNLVLELRISPWGVPSAVEKQLALLERIARGEE
jgi:hypothetical protein